MTTSLLLLAQAAYVPMRDPMWGGWNYWPLMLLPLCALIAVAYKGIRVEDIANLPREATRWALLLLASLVGIAGGLAILVWAIGL